MHKKISISCIQNDQRQYSVKKFFTQRKSELVWDRSQRQVWQKYEELVSHPTPNTLYIWNSYFAALSSGSMGQLRKLWLMHCKEANFDFRNNLIIFYPLGKHLSRGILTILVQMNTHCRPNLSLGVMTATAAHCCQVA